MSFKQVSTLAAAAGATVALSAAAYADTGKSPNGPSGPAGNPNPPQSQPHANAPQGPEGNGGGKSATAHSKSHGKSATAHSKSHGKSGESHPATRPAKSHANPSPGTPRKGGRSDRPAGKITICHATRSVKNPYVEITISVNGLHGHGPADDSRHHAGSWKDIIPAPDGGCPATVQTAGTTGSGTENQQGVAGVQGSAGDTPQNPAGSGVLGARASGGSAPKSGVLGARASGRAPAAAVAARRTARAGSLPFTGTQLAFVLIAAAVALLGGFALRRVLARQS